MSVLREAEIVPARREHVPQVNSLAKAHGLSGAHVEEVARSGFLVSDFVEKDYEGFLQHADHFYVMLKGDAVLGFTLAYSSHLIGDDEWLNQQIKIRHPEPFVLIKQICVDPHLVGQGIAGSIYRYLFSRVPELPCLGAIVLEPLNKRSIDFHERLGFRKWFEETPDDGMRRGVWRREADLTSRQRTRDERR